jgi:hypothetical protein
MLLTYLTDQLLHSKPYLPTQNFPTIFRHPHPSAGVSQKPCGILNNIRSHPEINTLAVSILKPSPEGEGFNPPAGGNKNLVWKTGELFLRLGTLRLVRVSRGN